MSAGNTAGGTLMRFVFTFWFATLLASAGLAASLERDALIEDAVQREFLAPFARWQAARSEFSRAAMAPAQMRARVLGTPQKDAAGAEFVSFAVDTREADGDW